MRRIDLEVIVPVAVLVVLLTGAPPVVEASLVGDAVTCAENLSDMTCSTSSAAVTDPGSEFTIVFGGAEDLFTVDISASSITIAITLLNNSVTFPPGVQTLSFTDLDSSAGDIVGVDLAISGIVNNFTVGDISFTAHSIVMDLVGTSWANERGSAGTAVITLLFADSAAVPVPATLVTLVAGAVIVGAVRAWRRR